MQSSRYQCKGASFSRTNNLSRQLNGISSTAANAAPFHPWGRRERIAAALLELDTLHREVLVLRFHEELSLEEIAKITRAPLSTVKSRLYRGLVMIKPKVDSMKNALLEALKCMS